MEENIKMEDILSIADNETGGLNEGSINTLTIVGFTSDLILVDIGKKSEGMIPKSEIPENVLSSLKAGDSLKVFVYAGGTKLSFKKARDIETWDTVIEKKQNNEIVHARILKTVKGGFSVELGSIEGFMPASHLDIRPIPEVKSYIGKSFDMLIIEADKHKHNLIVSRKKLLEIEREKIRDEIFSKVNVGDIIAGKVVSLAQFGAFIDIGGIEALLHEKEFSWDKNEKLKKNMKINEEVSLKVIGMERTDGRISLSRKAMLPHPWDGIETRYPLGSEVEGVITSLTNFGAFIEIDKGVEGLIHVSEFSWKEKTPNIKALYKVGSAVKAKVLSVDRQNEKIALSIKRLQINPWEEAVKLYPIGSKQKGKITHLTPFGAFIELPIGIEGLLHVTDMDWLRKIKHPNELLKMNQEIEYIITSINAVEEKIVLSIKELKENPFVKYKIGSIIQGKVKKLMNYGAFVNLEPGIDAFLHISEIFKEQKDEKEKEKLKHPKDALQEGQLIQAKVVKIDKKERSIEISTKKYERDMEKEEIKKYINNKFTPTLGDIFGGDNDET